MATDSNHHQTSPVPPHRAGFRAGKWILTGLGLFWAARKLLHLGSFGRRQPAPIAPAQQRPLAELPLRGHEERDASPAWIAGSVGFLILLVFCIHLILAGWLSSLKRTTPPTDHWLPVRRAATSSGQFPRLQLSPPAELERFRALEQAELNSYGWMSRTTGTVRVPIARAIELVLKEGLPTRSATTENQAGPSSLQLIEQRSAQRHPQPRSGK